MVELNKFENYDSYYIIKSIRLKRGLNRDLGLNLLSVLLVSNFASSFNCCQYCKNQRKLVYTFNKDGLYFQHQINVSLSNTIIFWNKKYNTWIFHWVRWIICFDGLRFELFTISAWLKNQKKRFLRLLGSLLF